MDKGIKHLALNLQHFAEGNNEKDTTSTDNTEETVTDNQDETNPSTETKKTDSKSETDNQRIPYDRFKDKVDEVNELKDKLAKIERAKEAEETKELEEQNKYKELYEKTLETLEQTKEDALNRTKQSKLTNAGYTEAQVSKLTHLVEGETDEEIKASIEALKETFPTGTGYVDPSVDNSHRDKPAKKDKTDLGRSLYERIKGKK